MINNHPITMRFMNYLSIYHLTTCQQGPYMSVRHQRTQPQPLNLSIDQTIQSFFVPPTQGCFGERTPTKEYSAWGEGRRGRGGEVRDVDRVLCMGKWEGGGEMG